ncbi:GIY-YIG nuclease family protein [Candidatus Palauibacter sp.]|uniref:GIY-YIG nuclease family protein n=1 Tax=Candidatus Palauibacter sp. TaxID=3101350 RepID=UPI003AF2B695
MQQMPQFGPLMQSIMALDSFDKRRREYKRVGWIYAARNPSFVDPVFKIGQSKVSPVKRVDQLSNSSVYRPFELVYWVHVSDRDRAEGYAHQLLDQYRVNPAREFFQASVMDVARALDLGGRSLLDPSWTNRSIGVPGARAGAGHGSLLTLRHRESGAPAARFNPYQLRQLRQDADLCGAGESRLNLPIDSGGAAAIREAIAALTFGGRPSLPERRQVDGDAERVHLDPIFVFCVYFGPMLWYSQRT